MSARRILLVEDQRDISRMLRAALELLRRGYVVVEVPSGEEAMLEVKRGPIDLVVTDVRLPGISGLELVGQVRKANPDAQVIVISGLASAEVEREAHRLDANAFFPKPLDTEKFLEAVQAMLDRPLPSAVAGPAPAAPEPAAPAIADRLVALRHELGALVVFLAGLDGRIHLSAGDMARLDLNGLLPHLVVSCRAALNVASRLGNTPPAILQFYDGRDFDVYTISVGQSHVLGIVLEDEPAAHSMARVVSHGRACAGHVLHALPAFGAEQGMLDDAGTPASPNPQPMTHDLLAPLAGQPAEAEPGEDARAYWEAAVASLGAEAANVNALSFAEAQKLGLLPKDLTE